jgi:hypothetical protein
MTRGPGHVKMADPVVGIGLGVVDDNRVVPRDAGIVVVLQVNAVCQQAERVEQVEALESFHRPGAERAL